MGVKAKTHFSYIHSFLDRSLARRLLLFAFCVTATDCARAQALPPASLSQLASSQSLQGSAEPTGDQRCAVCHPSEVEGYARSAMARSLRRAAQEPAGVVNARGTRI